MNTNEQVLVRSYVILHTRTNKNLFLLFIADFADVVSLQTDKQNIKAGSILYHFL